MKQKITQAKKQDFSTKWQLLISNLVRPPRKQYPQSDIGNKSFYLFNKKFIRQDHKIPHQKQKLQLSIFKSKSKSKQQYKQELTQKQTQKQTLNLILYLHSNASNKLEAIQLLEYLPENVALGCFDFVNCGNHFELENGEYCKQKDVITLGIRQSDQTKSIISYLKYRGYRIALWGRSMGAVTALLTGQKIIVADSPFLSFKSACKQVANNYSPWYAKPFICCLFPCIYGKLRTDVQKKAMYNTDQLDVRKNVRKMGESSTVILLAAKNDEVVGHYNSVRIYQMIKGDNKYFQLFEGTHNSKRPPQVMKKVMALLKNKFQKIEPQFRKNAVRNDTKMIEMGQTNDRMNQLEQLN